MTSKRLSFSPPRPLTFKDKTPKKLMNTLSTPSKSKSTTSTSNTKPNSNSKDDLPNNSKTKSINSTKKSTKNHRKIKNSDRSQLHSRPGSTSFQLIKPSSKNFRHTLTIWARNSWWKMMRWKKLYSTCRTWSRLSGSWKSQFKLTKLMQMKRVEKTIFSTKKSRKNKPKSASSSQWLLSWKTKYKNL